MRQAPFLETPAAQRRRAARRRRRARLRLVVLLAAAMLLGGTVLAGRAGEGGSPSSAHAGDAAPTTAQAVLGPLPLQADLDKPDTVRLDFGHPPRAGLLVNLDSGRVLWRRNPTRSLPIASVTKLMTALVAVDRLDPDDMARISAKVLHYSGSGVGLLPRGKRVKVETLLYGLLLPSGNDAARSLALHVAGTLRGFEDLMNRRARELGLRCTRFSSPDGIVDEGNHSCAVDLAALARAVLDQPRLARIVRTRTAVRPLPIKGGRVWLANNNPLLRLRYPGTIGVKTGYTDAAGHCLVAAVRRRGHRYGIVLLHSPDTGRQAKALLRALFRLRR
jgi:D-alanyl-D-alanine carboxypeptidase